MFTKIARQISLSHRHHSTKTVTHSWEQWERLQTFLNTGQVCVIDGANGTEIQRRGGGTETFESGTAALQRPDLCQEVHMSYLENGADILITNSYSANRNVMTPSGNGDRASECIISSAAIARRASAAHIADRARTVSMDAALSNQAASQAVNYAATSAARATTSLGSNEGSEMSLQAAVDACNHASEMTALSLHAAREAHVSAAAANAAAKAAMADSEGKLFDAVKPLRGPAPERIKGWDAAGFGQTITVGSLSTHPPEFPKGGADSAAANWPDPKDEADAYMEAAHAHAKSGVDMLFLEMMKDEDHAPRAVRAAAASGLPVFLGISTRTDEKTGDIVLFGSGNDSVKLTKEWFDSLKDLLGNNLVGVNVMHTNFSSMSRTLSFVRNECEWEGALGAYPDHGVFAAPDWIFAELNNKDAVEHVETWVKEYGVQLVGGCCGLGPEYITAVSAFTRRHNALVREIRSVPKNYPPAC